MPIHNCRLIVEEGEVKRLLEKFRPTVDKLTRVSVFMREQVDERFQTHGASSGQPWPSPKWRKAIGADDGRALLVGPRSYLRDQSWFNYGENKSAVVASDATYSHVQEVGTIGKGGLMPDIVPVKAKALFIPTSSRGESSVAQGGIRRATRGPKIRGTQVFTPLVKGRLKDGELQRWDEKTGTYKPGVPDFIFLKKVSIPPRPMLPVSNNEIQEAVEFAAKVIMEAES